MSNRAKNRAGYRICFGCKVEFELTRQNFHVENGRPAGLAYRCISCQSAASKRKVRRPDRWLNMTPDQKARKAANSKKYRQTVGVAIQRLYAYKAIDKRKGYVFDLDLAWYEENIEGKPCHYCSDDTVSVGCDRIDNKHGHTRQNVVPCCASCNVTRMDNFTYEEMILLGETVRAIKERRKQVRAALESGTAYV